MLKSLTGVLLAAAAFAVSPAQAAECIGTCGSASPNGDVTAPPSFGPNYSYISTVAGVGGAGQIAGVGGTNGSQFTTSPFTAAAGDALNFFFNYVTSDGSGSFTDYAYAQLLTATLDPVAFLFTARTTPSGNTSPGFGLPANSATLTPATTPIIAGGPTWAQLGSSSGDCYASGCGLTGWIASSYTIEGGGSYVLRLGVTNVGDTAYQSGLAFAGVTVGGVEVPTPGTGAVPEPSTWAMLLLGFFGVGGVLRRRQAGQGTPAIA